MSALTPKADISLRKKICKIEGQFHLGPSCAWWKRHTGILTIYGAVFTAPTCRYLGRTGNRLRRIVGRRGRGVFFGLMQL